MAWFSLAPGPAIPGNALAGDSASAEVGPQGLGMGAVVTRQRRPGRQGQRAAHLAVCTQLCQCLEPAWPCPSSGLGHRGLVADPLQRHSAQPCLAHARVQSALAQRMEGGDLHQATTITVTAAHAQGARWVRGWLWKIHT